MKRLRWALITLGTVLVLGAVVLIAASTALNNETFARWLLEEAAARSNGALRVQSVRGTLGDGLQIETVGVDFGSGAANARSVRLTLDWRSLLARSIVLEELSIDRLEVVVQPGAPAGPQPEPTDLSLLVLIRAIAIAEIEIVTSEARHTLSAAQAELRLLRNHLELNSISFVYDEISVTGDTAFTLTDELAIDGDICIDGILAQENVVGCVVAGGTVESLRLDAQLERPFPATAVGTLELSATGFVDLALTWRDAALGSLPDAGSERGTAQVTGTWERLRIAADGVLAYRSEAAGFDGSFVVDADSIAVERLRLEQLPATAEISATVARDLSQANAEVSLRELDPQRWLPAWPGDLDLSAQVSIAMQPDFVVTARDIVVNGALREYPLAATGAVSYSEAGLTIEALRVVSRSDQVLVSGAVGDSLALDVDADIANIGVALPDATGSLTAELEIGGTVDQPTAAGMVTLTDFAIAGINARAVQITGVVGIAADDPIELAVSAADLDVSGRSVRDAIVGVTGSASSHRFEARAVAEDWNVSLASDGAIVDRTWRGRVDRLEFSPGEFGVWRLTTPADVSYGPEAYAVSDLCLTYTLSQICASVSVAGTSEDVLRVDASNFDVGILGPFMPPDIRARGLINARAELSNFIADPRGDLALETADAQIDIALADGVFFPIPIEQLSLGALLYEAGAAASLSLRAAEMGTATAALAVTGNPRAGDSGLDGTVNLQWRDAAALALLSPDVEDVEGRIGAALTLGGTVANPVLGGTAQWTDGSLTIPAWALVVDGIMASINTSFGEEALFQASGNVDGTPVNIDGTVALDPQRGWPMQLRLRGEDVSLVQLAGIEIVVSPELEARVQLPRIEVDGRVRIPRAHIRDVALPQQAVAPSADAVVHGRTSDVPARAIEMIASLSLELGEDVTYEDANLNATVTGGLDLDYRSGVGAAAEGELTVRGEYNAYGTPLALERGQLIFVGPLDDPSLDIRAVRALSEVTVGAQLTGTLRAPVTTLFSDPAMSEAETLSWLLFGQPLDVARESESRALRNAALSMGLQQALPVIERIGDTLGFDDFAIRTSESDVSALMAGKYLSPNLYFRYSYGLFNRIGGILLRYRINDRFSLETRSGEHSSMDLLYTVEKD